MHERLEQQRFDGVDLALPHAFDLLDDVLPIHLIVDPLAAGDAAQECGLTLAPGHHVGLVEVAHRALGSPAANQLSATSNPRAVAGRAIIWRYQRPTLGNSARSTW